MTEEEWVRAAIKRIKAKRSAVRDADSRKYYDLCLIGWEAHLRRLTNIS